MRGCWRTYWETLLCHLLHKSWPRPTFRPFYIPWVPLPRSASISRNCLPLLTCASTYPWPRSSSGVCLVSSVSIPVVHLDSPVVDMKLLQHPTLTHLSLDLPTPHGSYTSEDILRALFGGADMPRLRHLTVIAQASSFKRSDSGWQVAFWHKTTRSRMGHRSILPRELASQLASLLVQLESQQTGPMRHAQRSLVIVEDTRLLDLLQVGTGDNVLRVEHTTGARIVYPDEAFVLGFTQTSLVLQTRKRKTN
jgi:hypothetical protein